jgi:hypothetical protein
MNARETVVPCRETFARGERVKVSVVGPVDEDGGGAIHEAFWPAYLASFE